MKRAILLVIVYFLMQLLASLLSMGLIIGVNMVRYGAFVTDDLMTQIMAPSLVLGFVLMSAFLWERNYLKDARLWNPTTPSFLGWSALLGICLIFLLDSVLSLLNLPDWLDSTFDALESGWVGILAVAVLGPVLEEMLFRGAITTELLKHYEPKRAILFSGVIFGIFHINPAQVVPAMIIGFVLAWLYVRTKSLVPGILIHVINNSLSCYLSAAYPGEESILDLLGTGATCVCLLIALVVGYISFRQCSKDSYLAKK